MNKTKFLPIITGICLSIVTLTSVLSYGQQVEQPPDLWLIRSQTITEFLVKDAAALTPFDQAILFARLGDVWWKDNPERARSWMQKAVEGVEYVPNRENAADRSQRLAAARVLLSIIAPRDKKLGLRLTEVFTLDAERASSAERNMNADALIEEALAIVDRDPQRAAALGAASLRAGRPTSITALLWKLRSRDPKLADALFRQAVTSARETYDRDLSLSLIRVAFPASEEPPESEIPAPPDSLRAELLQVVVAYFQHTLTTTDGQEAFCSSNGSTIYRIAPLLPQFDRLLPPEQAASMRQWMVSCQSTLPSVTQQRIDNAQRNSTPKTVDDFLDAADKAKDSNSKTIFQARAAQLAASQKNFDRAIGILDGMDNETRKFLNESGGTWNWWRQEWAGASALDHFKHSDPPGAQRVMAAVPDDLRPAAQITLAYGLSPVKEYRTMTVELAENARKGLAASNMPEAVKVDFYFALVRLYAKFSPLDANGVLKETITALNHIESTKSSASTNSSNAGASELSSALTTYSIPIVILENNESAVLETVSSVESPTKRALMRLGLLNASLERHRASIAPRKKPGEIVKEKRS